MRLFISAIVVVLLLQLRCTKAADTIGGITRNQFQTAIHTLVDDEMTLLLESWTNHASTNSSSSDIRHRSSEASKSTKHSSSTLRGSIFNATVIDELDILFARIVSHGWETVISRSLKDSTGKELFLVCHESLPSLDTERLASILEAFDLKSAEFIVETVHSTLERLCVIMYMPVTIALDYISNSKNDDLALTPWVDVMKLSAGIISQLFETDVSLNATVLYSIVFSVVPSEFEVLDNIVKDVVEMANSGQRRQQEDSHPLVEAFSLTKSSNNLSSNRIWSRMLDTDDCAPMLNRLIAPFDNELIYEFSIDTYTMEACLVSLLVSLAVHPAVSRIGTKVNGVELHNIHASWAIQGGSIDTTGSNLFPFTAAGLNGVSQVVGISDTGLDVDNCYFMDSPSLGSNSDRVSIYDDWNTSNRKILRYQKDPNGGDLFDELNGHGTHVSATIVGSHINGLGPEKRGIAPAARAIFYDICNGQRCLSPAQKWFDSATANANVKPGVLSASWGTRYLPIYDWTCYQYDKLVFEHPDILLVSSAGNNGDKYDEPVSSIGAPASCKNIVAVGATFNVQTFGHKSSIASFSSRGPSSDGRIKPEIVAPGYKLSSAIAGHHDCESEEPEFLRAGTSMSAPIVSGSALLIRQYFQEGYYPCGYRGCGVNIDPSGSLMKAVLLNGAQFQTSIVHASSGVLKAGQTLTPYDNTQGFGEVNLLNSLSLRDENDFGMYVRNDMALRVGEECSIEVEMNLRRCTSDFSVTLAWYDPPAPVGCTSCLVNDLDLVVKNVESSVSHYPNGLSAPDRTNTAERVQINRGDILFGQRYRITVSVSHFDPRFNLQKFSIAAKGCFTSPDEKTTPSKTPVMAATKTTTEHQLTSSYRLMSKYHAAGIMFSVKARKSGIFVKGFSITTHLAKNASIYIYKLKDLGHHLNFTEVNDESSWEMISPPNGFAVNGTGLRALTVLPNNVFRVPIPDGATQSFYLTFADQKAIVCGRPLWTNTQHRHRTRDNNIKIEGGIGELKLFGGRTVDPCFFDGSMFYDVEHINTFGNDSV